MTRREARELIMQMLYETTFHEDQDKERVLYDKLETLSTNEVGKKLKTFMEQEYFGILDRQEELDAIIETNCENWNLSRIAKVDLVLLRMAVYEMKWGENIPYKVAVNEAIEIAKKYSTDKSPKFINGVLGKIITQLEG